jgi:hypothetical protein
VVVDVPIEREAGDTIGVASYIETATSLPDPDLTNNNAEEQTAVAERPPYEYDSNDDGGGGGCTLSGSDEPDVTLPALLVIATGYFIRLSPRKRRSKT